ncbi:MAG: FAD-dependent monooxygenase [Pseudomonadota bacterium]
MPTFAIVGGGIAGLAAALALAPLGPVRVFERRSAEAANAGAGIQLSPNAIKALRAIGAADAVEAVATAPQGLTVQTAGRRTPNVRLAYDAALLARYGAPYRTASRSALHGALLSVAAAHPAITLITDTPITRLSGTATGVALGDGEADFVVVADGVNSGLRRALLGDGAREAPHIAWRGIGAVPGNDTTLTMADGLHVVRYALSDGRDNVVLIAPRRVRHPDALAGRPIAKTLGLVSGWTPWPLSVQPRHRYGFGTIAFAGDAAHAMLPFLAQGGAMALEDAAVLAASVRRHGATPAATEAYAAARAPRTKRMASQSDRQGFVYHLPMPLSYARDLAMRRLGPAGILSRVDWIYGWAPPEG